jgi:carbonic anhydrase
VVVCCSDSRVGPELVFGQGLGDIVVVRVAGNVVDPVVQGSVEYAVEHLHAPLIVVMGHDDCGAVKAAVADDHATGAIAAVVGRIRGSVEAAESQGLKDDAAVNAVTDLNIKASIQEISASPIVSKALAKGAVKILGARYHLASGRVEWLETKPSPTTATAPAK